MLEILCWGSSGLKKITKAGSGPYLNGDSQRKEKSVECIFLLGHQTYIYRS